MEFETMYRDYVKRLNGSELLIRDVGFIQYTIDRDTAVVMDVYVKPEFRNRLIKIHPFVYLCQEVINIVKELGCVRIAGKIDMNNPDKEKIMRLHLANGMKLSHTQDDFVWTEKEI